jgi:hypothetical protein
VRLFFTSGCLPYAEIVARGPHFSAATFLPAGVLKKLTWWFTDCSLVTTRNSTFTIFLRFLIAAKSATCSDGARRQILTF